MKKILMIIISIITFFSVPKIIAENLSEEANKNNKVIPSVVDKNNLVISNVKESEEKYVKHESRVDETEKSNLDNQVYCTILTFLVEEPEDNQGTKYTGRLVYASDSDSEKELTGTYSVTSEKDKNSQIQDLYPKTKKETKHVFKIIN